MAALHSAPFGWLVATRVADGLHGLMDLTCTWRDLGTLPLPHPTALHLGTLVEPSLVHRQVVRQPTAAQHHTAPY